MNYRYFIFCALVCLITACKQDMHLNKIEGKRIEINDTLSSSQEIEDFIKPFRENVNKNLDSVLAYSVDTFTKNDGEFNTAIGNMLADAVKELSNPIFNSRTGNNIDVVLLNHGGIRSILSKGNVTTRNAYQIMPFENTVVVAELKGIHFRELIDYLLKSKQAHPISGLKLVMDANFNLVKATINGKTIDDEKTYYVATQDYLYNGGDSMSFFENSLNLNLTDYKVRNVFIDYFTKVDTINPTIDDRFIQTN